MWDAGIALDLQRRIFENMLLTHAPERRNSYGAGLLSFHQCCDYEDAYGSFPPRCVRREAIGTSACVRASGTYATMHLDMATGAGCRCLRSP